MKKQIKRTVSVMLFVLMIVSLFSIVPFEVGAATYGDWEYTLENDYTCTITKYKGSAKNVTVPATIYGNKVARLNRTFEMNKNIESVTISSGIKEIGQYCFYECSNLKRVSVPNTVTTIEYVSFHNCVNIESIVIPGSCKKIELMAFSGCKKMKTATINEGLKYIGEHSFEGCESIISLSIPNSVEEIDSLAFTGCTSLKSIAIGSGLKEIVDYNGAFMPWNGYKGTSALESITVNANNKYFSSENGILYNKNKTELYLYPQGKKDKSYVMPNTLTEIAYKAILYNIYFTEITVPKSLSSLEGSGIGYSYDPYEEPYWEKRTRKANFILRGYRGTKAELYARNNDLNFVEIVDKPAAPTVSVANGVNGLDVAWGKVANAQSYVVYYKTATTNWSSFSTSSTKATITNVGSGKYYYVQVQSIGSSGVKGNYSNVKTMTFLLRANITSLTYNGNNNLKWNAVPGANKYQIARLKSGDKAYTYFYSTTPSFTEKNAVGGIAYTYQVRAMYQTANNGTAYGAWSASKSVPTLVAPTVTLSNKSNGIRVTWNSIRGAIRYIVYFKKSTDKNWSSAITTNLYYPILNTQRGATYYVQVRPVGATVSQPYSSVKSIVYK